MITRTRRCCLMSSSIRKISLVTLQIILMILVISLAFNFAFTPKTTPIVTANDEIGLSSDDTINSLDNGGGSSSVDDPSGSGNDFQALEYFESTTSDEDVRTYNETGTPPEIVIDAPSSSANLIYYNLTITDTYTEGGIRLPDDSFDDYNQSVVLINSEIVGCVYQFNVSTSVFGYVFIDTLSFPLVTGPNGSNFTVYILGVNNTTGLPNVHDQYFVQNFTAPANFSWGEYVPYEGTDDKLVLAEGNYYIGITLTDSSQANILWLASNDTYNVNSDDDARTYFTANHTRQPEPIWSLQGKDMAFMYHYSDVAVTEQWGMKVNNTPVYEKTGVPWKGNATLNTTNSPIPPRNDGTFAF